MTTTEPTARKRHCFYIPVGQHVEGRGFVPSVVTEDEPGHAPLIGNGPFSEPWFWGDDYETAKRIAREANEKLGLTEDDVTEIILSSMRAGNVADAKRAAHQRRLIDLFGSDEEKADQMEGWLRGLFGATR